VLAATGADLSLRDALAAALGANRQLVELTGKLREENARLREDNARLLAGVAERDAELDRVRADLAVLQRMLFGRSSERSRPGPAGGAEVGGDEVGGDEVGGDEVGGDEVGGDEVGGDGGRGNGRGVKRGPGARAGRRDYSHLPRFEVFWDFPGGGYGCPECGEPFTLLGEHVSGQQVDWQVIVRVVVHCRRRYRRACGCRVPATVMAPGPPKAIGKGLFSNGFIAMLLTERYVAGRSMNSLVTGLARHGAEVSPATLAGTCAQAGGLLAPLAEAITARSRDSWHLHADETVRHEAPCDRVEVRGLHRRAVAAAG
jgi:transposase